MTNRIRRQTPVRTILGKRLRLALKHDAAIKKMAAHSGLSFRRAAERLINQHLIVLGY